MKRKINPRSRSQRAVSSTVKKIKSRLQIEHLDAFSKIHKRDVLKTRQWMEILVSKKEVSKLSAEQLEEVLNEIGLGNSPNHTTLPLLDIEKTFELRSNLCFEDGKWVEKQGKEWMNHISKIRQNESCYKERGGRVLTRSPKGATKEEKEANKYRDPLEVMYVRCPPWLALELNVTDESLVKKSAAEFAKQFELQTGYPVKAVNIHRESAHDVHLHITYSTVKLHRKSRSKRAIARKKTELRNQLKADMLAEGLPRDSASVAREFDKRGLTEVLEEYSYEETEYRKIVKFDSDVSQREWPVAKRDMHVLGAAYRNKAHIWQAASSDEDKDRIRKFREKSLDNAEEGTFSDRFVSKSSLAEESYVDWWAENLFQNLLLDGLSAERQQKVKATKEDCVSSYIKCGSTMIHPSEILLQDKKDEHKKNEKALYDEEVEQTIDHVVALHELAETQDLLEEKEQAIKLRSDEIEVKESSIADKKNELIEQGRREVLNAVVSTIDKREGEEGLPTKTKDEVLNAVGKIKAKADKFERIKAGVAKLLKWASSVKMPKKVKDLVIKLQDTMGIKDPDVDPDR